MDNKRFRACYSYPYFCYLSQSSVSSVFNYSSLFWKWWTAKYLQPCSAAPSWCLHPRKHLKAQRQPPLKFVLSLSPACSCLMFEAPANTGDTEHCCCCCWDVCQQQSCGPEQCGLQCGEGLQCVQDTEVNIAVSTLVLQTINRRCLQSPGWKRLFSIVS